MRPAEIIRDNFGVRSHEHDDGIWPFALDELGDIQTTRIARKLDIDESELWK